MFVCTRNAEEQSLSRNSMFGDRITNKRKKSFERERETDRQTVYG